MELFYEIKLETGAKYFARADESINLKVNDWCVVRKDRNLDYGQVLSVRKNNPKPKNDKKGNEPPRVERRATVVDKGKANENQMRAKSAFRTALKHIEQLGLPMKLLNAHYSFDRKLITFQFTAEGRVDFRELVKQLSRDLNTRIELRQIGVRDETGIMGGVGPCGQVICCCRFMKKFESINVRMAKEQDLSLNPGNISGICGRLKCCLRYEHEGYIELDRDMPRRGAMCECGEGRGKIVDRNLLTQQVTIQLDEAGKTISCPKNDVRVVYPEKYKVAAESSSTEEDIYAGLNEEEMRQLQELDNE